MVSSCPRAQTGRTQGSLWVVRRHPGPFCEEKLLSSQITETKGQLTPDFLSITVFWPGCGLPAGESRKEGMGAPVACSDYNHQEVTGWECWSR